MDLGSGTRSGRRHLVPDALTLSRPFLTLAAAVALVLGNGLTGGILYLIAYLTDVADGLLARVLRVASARGQRLDGLADVTSMAFLAAGFALAAVRAGRWWVCVLIAVVLVGREVVGRRWVAAHTVVGKAIGGAVRIGILVLFAAFSPPGDRWQLLVLGALVFIPTFVYEGRVTLRERASGERPVR